MWVLGHGLASSQACPVLGYDGARRGVLVLEEACLTDICQQKVVPEKLELCRIDMVAQLVDLGAGLVVNVDVPLLGDRKERLVMQPTVQEDVCEFMGSAEQSLLGMNLPDVSGSLIEVDLGMQSSGLPIHSCNMPFSSSKSEVATIGSKVAGVGTKLV